MTIADTCVVIWIVTASPALSKAAGEAIASAAQEGSLAISGVTLYELAWLVRNNRIQIATPLDSFLARIEGRFKILPVSSVIARFAVELPESYPRDPMDRIIGATALAHEGLLVTSDKAIRRSRAVPVIW